MQYEQKSSKKNYRDKHNNRSCVSYPCQRALLNASTAIFQNRMVAVTECKQPEACTSICERQSKEALDPKFAYDACLYVNCQEDGYFLGAMQEYQWCLESQKEEAERLKRDEEELKRQEEETRKQEEARQAELKRQQEEETKRQDDIRRQEAQNQKTQAKKQSKPSENIKILIFGLDVKEGNILTTGKNERKTIVFNDGSKIAMEPNSTFNFLREGEYHVPKGKFSFYFKRLLEGREAIRVHTATAVTSVRGTEFLTSVTKTKTIVQVLDGVVTVSNLKGTKSVDVSTGYQATVTKTSVSKPKPFKDSQLIIP